MASFSPIGLPRSGGVLEAVMAFFSFIYLKTIYPVINTIVLIQKGPSILGELRHLLMLQAVPYQ